MNYNPYDLVPLLINGKAITGRPFEFDSEVVNQKKMTNAFGSFIKPTKVATVCPDCSQGLLLDVRMGEPPFAPFVTLCQYCHPAPPPLPDPFINPVKSGRIPAADLDPLLQELRPLESAPVGSVADRFKLEPNAAAAPPTESPKEPVRPQRAAPTTTRGQKPRAAKKAAKETTPKKPQPQKDDQKLEMAIELAQENAAKPVEPPAISDFDLTRSTGRPVVERADGINLGEEQDFDDRDLLEAGK